MNEFDLGPLPGVHHRAARVEGARREIEEALDGLASRHGLTMAELFMLTLGYLERLSQRSVAIERRNRKGQEST